MTTHTTTRMTGTTHGWDARKPPVSFEGDPLDTVRGMKTAVMMTINTLATRKKADSTIVARANPETVDPGTVERRIPIIAAVPPCAGRIALIAVPPCDAPQAVLNRTPLAGYDARRMFRQASPISPDSAVFSASARTS